jgi:hypothetical protein
LLRIQLHDLGTKRLKANVIVTRATGTTHRRLKIALQLADLLWCKEFKKEGDVVCCRLERGRWMRALLLGKGREEMGERRIVAALFLA